MTVRRRVLASAALIGCGIVAGLLGADTTRQVSQDAVDRVVEHSRHPPSLSFLLVRNLRVLAIVSAGAFAAGVPSVLALVWLGEQAGRLPVVGPGASLPLLVLLAGLAPHGLVEYAGYTLAGAAGLSGWPIVRRFADGDRAGSRRELEAALRLVGVALALVLAAALVEQRVTPLAIRAAAAATVRSAATGSPW